MFQRMVSFNSQPLSDTQFHFTYNYWSHSFEFISVDLCRILGMLPEALVADLVAVWVRR
jgi:hypothetical protein